tara:strand:+ start:16 stop:243 length:228 start_codon:yes stop_codon:yes gene_type:complete
MKKSNPLTAPIVNRPNLEVKLKEYKACDACADTVDGHPHGIIRTVDVQTNSNKLDAVYNTTTTCPKCKGEKYIWV